MTQIYLPIMNCPKCDSANKIKRGKIRGKQRYSCKSCNYNYTVIRKKTVKSDALKRQALQLYLEGLDFRSIGRMLQVSHVSTCKKIYRLYAWRPQ